MKLLLALILVGGFAFADDKEAAETLIQPVNVDKKSVKVVSFKAGPTPKLYHVRLGFKIKPIDTCQENYVGFYQQANRFEAVYSKRMTDICADSAISRDVEHEIDATLDTDAKWEFFIGKQRFSLERKGGKMEVHQAIF